MRAIDTINASRPDSGFGDIDTGGCSFVNGATTAIGSLGKYIEMTVVLEATDRDGDSDTTSRTIRLYTNGACGF